MFEEVPDRCRSTVQDTNTYADYARPAHAYMEGCGAAVRSEVTCLAGEMELRMPRQDKCGSSLTRCSGVSSSWFAKQELSPRTRSARRNHVAYHLLEDSPHNARPPWQGQRCCKPVAAYPPCRVKKTPCCTIQVILGTVYRPRHATHLSMPPRLDRSALFEYSKARNATYL